MLKSLNTIFVAVVVLLFCFESSYSQKESSYSPKEKLIKKPIFGLTDVFVYSGLETDELKLNRKAYQQYFDENIKLERFFYTVLSTNYTSDLLVELKDDKNLSSDILLTKIKELVMPKIDKTLSSDNKHDLLMPIEHLLIKSMGDKKEASENQVMVLINSSYLYFPYISKLEFKDNNLTITSGINWYRILYPKTGEVTTEFIKTTEVTGSKAISTKDDEELSTKLNDAQMELLSINFKNLNLQTRKIIDFRLVAPVEDIISSNTFTANVGTYQGIYMDNGFDIIVKEENSMGISIEKEIGFGRVLTNSIWELDANQKPVYKEQAVIFRYLGENPMAEVGRIRERPNFGIDAKSRASFKTGMNILQKHSKIWDPVEITLLSVWTSLGLGGDFAKYLQAQGLNKAIYSLTEDAESGIGGQISLDYNLAPITKINQLFYGIDIDFLVPLAEPNLDANAFTFVLGAKNMIKKKFWLGRFNVGVEAGGGIDILSQAGEYSSLYSVGTKFPFSLFVMAPSIDLKGNFEYLINPDLAFNAGAGYSIGLQPLYITYVVNDVEYDLTTSLMDYYSDLKMSGFSINVGITYTLPKLETNVFDFLDKIKKY